MRGTWSFGDNCGESSKGGKILCAQYLSDACQ